MEKKTLAPRGVGITNLNNRVLLFNFLSSGKKNNTFQIAASKNGFSFTNFKKWAEIVTEKGQQEEIEKCLDFRIGRIDNSYFLTYKKRQGNTYRLYGALWGGFSHWQKTGEIADITETGMLVPGYRHQNKYILYFGERDIKLAWSDDLLNWHIFNKPVFTLSKNLMKRSFRLKIGTIIPTKKGILLVYFLCREGKTYKDYSLRMIAFDKNNPAKLLTEQSKPIWHQNKAWEERNAYPLGVVKVKQQLFVYWQTDKGEILVLHFPFFNFDYFPEGKGFFSFILRKFIKNPILKPLTKNRWESKATFNAAAIFDERKVHFIYRAVGDGDLSVWGYASSKDGLHIDERLEEPIYISAKFSKKRIPKFRQSALPFYLSGCGGFGGCEDPRMTKIDDRYYVTYTAFDGSSPPRVGLTSIRSDDFLNKRWKWKNPVFISPPNEIHKNWVIFPEKIGGKYAILHSLSPKIRIDYFDSLNFDGSTFIKSRFFDKSNKLIWEDRTRGVGPPPIKTKDGWLVIYHAMDKKDPGLYKMGAMILDYKNPTKVLYRSRQPILEPSESYENQGLKPGIVYSCGAVVSDNQLLVYYGGADTVTCLATADLNKFLAELKSDGNPKLNPRFGEIKL